MLFLERKGITAREEYNINAKLTEIAFDIVNVMKSSCPRFQKSFQPTAGATSISIKTQGPIVKI